MLALIDGDGYIFKDELLKRGYEGGQHAVETLNESIITDVGKEFPTTAPAQVWVYFFCNLKGLEQTLVGSNACTAEDYDAFMRGFNEVNPRFTINDVHSGKDAADSKIKGEPCIEYDEIVCGYVPLKSAPPDLDSVSSGRKSISRRCARSFISL